MMNTLLVHLWQSTLFAGLAALLTLAFANNRASIRYAIWLAGSLKFLIPVAPLIGVAHDLTWRAAAPAVVAPEALLEQPVAPAATVTAGHVVALAAATAPTGIDLATVALMVWGLGAAAALLWWLVRWLRVRAVVSESAPLPLAAPIPVRSSASLREPGLFGIFRPVIVLPESALATLSQQQVSAILVHELTHWRRRDNLTAALHMIVEGLFWFHPLVWWLGRRLVAEREQACDEAVILSSCDRQAYAEAILCICRTYLQRPLLCVSGVAGGDLKKRVATIMTAEVGDTLRNVKKLLLASLTCAALVVPIAAGVIGAWRAAAADLEAGLGALDHGDYRAALSRLRPLAEQGNATAEDRVGEIYDRGLGVPQDYAQSVAWYRKAALQGDATGQQALSTMYAQGHGVPHDRLAAALWARQGLLGMIGSGCDPKLMFEFEGRAPTQTTAEQMAATQAAAEKGDALAAMHLGSMYELGPWPNEASHIDHGNALKWISRSAMQGNAKGEAALAALYLKGSAVAPNDSAALTWMRKAADQGFSRAQCSLAAMYDQGIGVVADHGEAAKWYRAVADAKPSGGPFFRNWARVQLANLYETGQGVARNDAEAIGWLRKAAEDGYPWAETRLGSKLVTGEGLPRDKTLATRLLSSAANKGLPAAQIALGNLLYADGKGDPGNRVYAYKWFSIAARYSTSQAQREAARNGRDAVAGRLDPEDLAVAQRLVDRWLPANDIGGGGYAGGDM